MKYLKSEKLFVQVFNEIKDYIVKNNLGANDKLPTEFELCEMLGVSRNIVREALKAMELMGVIKSIPGNGRIIQEFNMDFIFQYIFYFLVADDKNLIREILDIRKRLELSYMREAYHTLTDADIALLRDIVKTMKEKWEKQTFYHEEDRKFHMTIFRHLNNKTLKSLFEAAWHVDETFETKKKAKYLGRSIAKHEKIVAALEARNLEEFEKAMIEHFESGKYRFSDEFEEE